MTAYNDGGGGAGSLLSPRVYCPRVGRCGQLQYTWGTRSMEIAEMANTPPISGSSSVQQAPLLLVRGPMFDGSFRAGAAPLIVRLADWSVDQDRVCRTCNSFYIIVVAYIQSNLRQPFRRHLCYYYTARVLPVLYGNFCHPFPATFRILTSKHASCCAT